MPEAWRAARAAAQTALPGNAERAAGPEGPTARSGARRGGAQRQTTATTMFASVSPPIAHSAHDGAGVFLR